MEKKNDKQYTITLSERQLSLIGYACKVTNQLIRGQLSDTFRERCELAFERLPKNYESADLRQADEFLWRFTVGNIINELRKLCWGLEVGEDPCDHYSPDADILFDMQMTINRAVWMEKDPDMLKGVPDYAPVGDEENIIVTKNNDNGNS